MDSPGYPYQYRQDKLADNSPEFIYWFILLADRFIINKSEHVFEIKAPGSGRQRIIDESKDQNNGDPEPGFIEK
jgi:hypothetical protein